MKELLGLLVLSWPLAIGSLLFALVLFLAIAAFTISKGKGRRWAIAVAVLLGGFAVVEWDDILGSVYLEHLCNTKRGAQVYKRVLLPPELWDENGQPTFVDSFGNLDIKVLGKRFAWEMHRESIVNFGVQMERWRSSLVDRPTGETVADTVTYFRRFGWLRRATSLAPNIGETCGTLTDRRGVEDEEVRKENRTLIRAFERAK